MHCLGIPPEIELSAVLRGPGVGHLGGNCSAHNDELLRKIGHLRVDTDGLCDVGKRACSVDGHFMRILVDHADDEMGCVFVGGLGSGIALFERRDFVGTVKDTSLAVTSRPPVPRTLVFDFAV